MLIVAHLTDIHIGGELDPILSRPERIGAAIASHLSADDVLAILLTGDISNTGQSEQFDLALTFFRRIEERIKKDFHGEITFVVSPGNHDCDFLTEPQDLRKLVLNTLASKPDQKLSPQYLQTCIAVQSNFFRFLDQLSSLRLAGEQCLRYKQLLNVSGMRIVFDCLNLAWVSQIREDKVTFPTSILPFGRIEEGCVIGVMHHPFNWLHPSAYREFRRKIRANADFIFSGHEHKWNIVETNESEASHCVQFEGSVLQDTDSDFSGFAVVEFDLRDKKYRAQSYQWNGTMYAPQDLGEWSSFRKFELTPPLGSWIPRKEFEEDLSDLGVTIRVGGKSDVYLEDVFVFPDLEASSDDRDDTTTTVRADILLKNTANLAGFVIQGDDRSGRTTLLKHLFKRYYENGQIPLYIQADKITRATEDQIEKSLESALGRQYGRTLPEYMQLLQSSRVLLVDDFDEVPIRSEKARRQLLERLRARAGVLVLVVSDVFEAVQFVDQEESNVYEALPKYRILPFGRLSRAKLIAKWVTIDSDEFLPEEERIRRIDEATKFVDLVVKWNMVPRYPIYLLTLLQAQKAGSPENFKDSGLGYYYQYLISDAMLGSGVPKDKLGAVEQYCTQFAWWLKSVDRLYVSLDELRDFNSEFSAKWVTLDFALVRNWLESGRILRVTGDVIEFRYNHIYYFFVAKYLAENFDKVEAEEFITRAAKEVYVRSNANILVFLTHFANKISIIEAITSTLNEQFSGCPVAQFAIRNESVEAMLRQLPALVYEGGRPEENREREARRQDLAHSDDNDGLLDSAEHETELSLSSRITVIFKAVEILGQILKTQYSTISRVRREQLIKDMLCGPLRALEFFYEQLRASPDALVSEFESRLAGENADLTIEDCRAIAQRVVGSIVLQITFAFVRKISEAVGSDAIAEDLRAVVQGTDDLAHMLVRLAALLDAQRGLPRVEIEQIRMRGAGSLIVDRIIQVLVVYHMYMFRTSYSDIRWAHDRLGIPNRVTVRTMLTGSPLSDTPPEESE